MKNYKEPIFIKEDSNFLEYPLWTVSQKSKITHLNVPKGNGFYEIHSEQGLPTRFDKIVLYFLLHKVFQRDKVTTDIQITRYEIAKNVLSQDKNFSKTKYDRIMLAVKKWQKTSLHFEGTFFQSDSHTQKSFSIIDSVSLDASSTKIHIRFNEQYIQQLKDSTFYKTINLDEYKKLARPIALRLYEIITKNLLHQDLWCIGIQELGQRLTLEKYTYPSQVIRALKPAIKEINAVTQTTLSFDYDKKRLLCIFSKQH